MRLTQEVPLVANMQESISYSDSAISKSCLLTIKESSINQDEDLDEDYPLNF